MITKRISFLVLAFLLIGPLAHAQHGGPITTANPRAVITAQLGATYDTESELAALFAAKQNVATIGRDTTVWSAEPTGANLVVGREYRADNEVAGWDPISYAGTTDYYVLWTGAAWKGIIDLAGNLLVESASLGGVILGDSTPDADGEIGFASNAYKWFANSEDLVLTAGANKWTFSSATSVDTMDFSVLNLVTTGTIQGAIKVSPDADGMDAAAMTAAGLYGTLFIATGAGTWILPDVAAAGQSVCLMDSGTAHDLILDVTTGSTIRLKGTEQADAIGITNAAGSSTGDFICVVSVAAHKWSTMGVQGTWVSQ